MLVDEFAPLADVVELIEDRGAFRRIEAFERGRHQAVDEQRLASGVRMRGEDRMIVVRDVADVALGVCLPGAVVFVDVQRALALELLLQRSGTAS